MTTPTITAHTCPATISGVVGSGCDDCSFLWFRLVCSLQGGTQSELQGQSIEESL